MGKSSNLQKLEVLKEWMQQQERDGKFAHRRRKRIVIEDDEEDNAPLPRKE